MHNGAIRLVRVTGAVSCCRFCATKHSVTQASRCCITDSYQALDSIRWIHESFYDAICEILCGNKLIHYRAALTFAAFPSLQVSANISVITFDEDAPQNDPDPDGTSWPALLKKKFPGYDQSGYSDQELMRHLHNEGKVVNLSTEGDPDDLLRQIESQGIEMHGSKTENYEYKINDNLSRVLISNRMLSQ